MVAFYACKVAQTFVNQHASAGTGLDALDYALNAMDDLAGDVCEMRRFACEMYSCASACQTLPPPPLALGPGNPVDGGLGFVSGFGNGGFGGGGFGGSGLGGVSDVGFGGGGFGPGGFGLGGFGGGGFGGGGGGFPGIFSLSVWQWVQTGGHGIK